MLQWLGVLVPVSASIVLVTAEVLGLSGPAAGGFVTRALGLFALFTILQLLVGHRMPSFEGPATITLAVIIFALDAAGPVDPLPVVGAGLLLSAGVLLLVALTGALRPLTRVYTPFVNGTFLILLGVAVVWAVLPQAVTSAAPWGRTIHVLALGAVVVTSVSLEVWGRGTWKALSLLVGFAIGMVVFVAGGGLAAVEGGTLAATDVALVRPAFDLDVAVPIGAVAVLLAMNSLGTAGAVSRACSEELDARRLERGVILTGLAHAVQAVIPGVATVPHAESAVLARRGPRVARESLLLACVVMGAAALLPATSVALRQIPPAVSHDLLVAVMVSLGFFGVRELATVHWRPARWSVFALSLGVCVVLIPGPPPWLPRFLSYLALSPILTGMAIALIGEALLGRPRRDAQALTRLDDVEVRK
jgi:xanthine/uracil permease